MSTSWDSNVNILRLECQDADIRVSRNRGSNVLQTPLEMAFLMDEYFLKIHGRVAVLHPYKKGGILSGKPALQDRLSAKWTAPLRVMENCNPTIDFLRNIRSSKMPLEHVFEGHCTLNFLRVHSQSLDNALSTSWQRTLKMLRVRCQECDYRMFENQVFMIGERLLPSFPLGSTLV